MGGWITTNNKQRKNKSTQPETPKISCITRVFIYFAIPFIHSGRGCGYTPPPRRSRSRSGLTCYVDMMTCTTRPIQTAKRIALCLVFSCVFCRCCYLQLYLKIGYCCVVKHAYAHPDSYHTMMNGPGYVTPRNCQTVAFNHPPRPSQPTEPVADHQRMRTKRPLSTVDQEEDAVIAYLNSKFDEWHNKEVRRSQ